MLREPPRTSYNLYKAQFFSSPSDLMKSTVVDESLSTNATRVLFHRKTTSLLQETTEWETYIRRVNRLGPYLSFQSRGESHMYKNRLGPHPNFQSRGVHTYAPVNPGLKVQKEYTSEISWSNHATKPRWTIICCKTLYYSTSAKKVPW